jgi:ABC-type cobalamin/Fe3+-siderophores transport system ATPase subunit
MNHSCPPMGDRKSFDVEFPVSSANHGQGNIVTASGSIVIVGANGAGKSRLGAWLDKKHGAKAHRIAAQRNLSMPESSTPSDVQTAQSQLFFGANKLISNNKEAIRWNSSPTTVTLNDFSLLMILLVTEEFEVSTKFRQEATKNPGTSAPKTRLDKIKEIWESVLPQRELEIHAGKVEARPKGNPATYNAREMSDGERVIFYLIGQALAVLPGTIIIIDEPEIHLHKSIQIELWNKIEAQRDDCLFVYLTHDLEFAASRIGAKKVALKSYADGKWDWFQVPEQDGIPEEILLQIVGSRKPVIFTEGGKTSLDLAFLRHIYSDFTVIPQGGCEQVIQATNVFNNLTALHRLQAYGLIDRDFKSTEELAALEGRKVFSWKVSEIENLLLNEPVIKEIAKALFKPADEVFSKMKERLLTELERKHEEVSSAMSAAEIESLLKKNFDAKAQGEASLLQAVQNAGAAIPVAQIYQKNAAYLKDIVKNSDYAKAIEVYPNKGMLSHLASLFGMNQKAFTGYVEGIMGSDQGKKIRDAVKQFAPHIS